MMLSLAQPMVWDCLIVGLLFIVGISDDQVILSNDEDNLQRATKHLNDIAKEYGMKINTSKTKSMSFKGKNIQRAKIVIDNKIIE
jgi:GTPase